MKRISLRKRLTAFPTPFVSPGVDRQPRLTQKSRGDGLCRRTEKIFVIKRTGRLPSTNGTHKKIRRILIFDNRPESLRLAFREIGNSHVDLSRPPRASSLELIVVSIVAMLALAGMFWPLL